MASIPKLIKAVLNVSRALPEQVLSLGHAVLNGLTGNSNFTNLPVDLNVLKAGLDAYSVSIGEAQDGGRKAIALRNKQGEDVVRMLRALATHVELNCKEDMNIFLSSGFQPRSTARAQSQPLGQPMILGISQGITGQLLVSIKAVRKAKSYDLRFGPAGPGGAVPAAWSYQTVPNAKAAVAIDGLVPGTSYVIQVRAYGLLGYTEWSDSAARMCI